MEILNTYLIQHFHRVAKLQLLYEPFSMQTTAQSDAR